MIDIENANIEFNKYVSDFNPEDSKIKLKIGHTKRVAMLSKKIAQNLRIYSRINITKRNSTQW